MTSKIMYDDYHNIVHKVCNAAFKFAWHVYYQTCTKEKYENISNTPLAFAYNNNV